MSVRSSISALSQTSSASDSDDLLEGGRSDAQDGGRLEDRIVDPGDDSPLHWRLRFNAVDLALYRRVRLLAHKPETVAWVRRYSHLGEHGGVWLAGGAAAAFVDRPRRRHWLRATAAVGAAYATSTSIKLAVGRKRPAVEDLPHLMATPTGLSFPSSHTTSSFAAARAFGALVPGPPLQLAAAAMGLSRLYLGVHYPSDVAAGAALGTLIGSLGR
jgi:membrane-associated phospholipid phosphatase